MKIMVLKAPTSRWDWQLPRIMCGGILILLTMLGCSGNTRYYTKQNVHLSATLRYGEAKYRTMSIGTQQKPFYKCIDQYSDVTIELSEKRPVPLGDLTVALIESVARKATNVDELNYKTPWSHGTKLVEVGTRVVFYVRGDKILQLKANSVGLQESEMPPRLGKRGSDVLYALPLTEEQVFQLFGQPDKLNDVFQQ